MSQRLTTEKQIFRNLDFILLNLNAFLVIVGYALSVSSDGASIGSFKILKSFFLLIAVVSIFRSLSFSRAKKPSPSVIFMLVFCFWVFLLSFFSEQVLFSISTSMAFIAPLIYVYFALFNLLYKYDPFSLLRAFTKSINLIYSFPIFAYLLSGAGFGQVNIYGSSSAAGQIFISNQYGWSSAIFILTSVDILINSRPGKFYRIFLLLLTLIDLYIALISGNRASWLSLIFGLLIFTIRFPTVRADFKFLLMIIPVAGVIWFSKIPDSSLNTRLNITESQIETGEARFITAQTVIKEFNENNWLWITGVGMFNYEIIANMSLSDYHNSYLEVLFGGGIVMFIMFLYFMLFKPLYNYARYYSRNFLLFSPLVIIPFFESNITGGQFLFYPWFIFMLLYNITPEKTLVQNKSVIQKNIPRPKPIHA